MRYVVAYAVYALSVTGLLLHLVPPQPASEPRMAVPADRDTQVLISVMDDYFALPCTMKVSALAADIVLFNTREEFEEAREALGC